MATIVTESFFRTNQSDYAKSLRAKYGKDGYNRYVISFKSKATNPLKTSNQNRINYLETALGMAKKALAKAKQAYRSYFQSISGLSSISSNQQATLAQKGIAAGKADMDVDLYTAALGDAYHSKGMYYTV